MQQSASTGREHLEPQRLSNYGINVIRVVVVAADGIPNKYIQLELIT